MKTTYINADGNGFGRAENPYKFPDGETPPPQSKFWEFDQANPPLPTLNPDSTPYMGKGRVMADIGYQYEPQDEDYLEWRDCDEAKYNLLARYNSEAIRILYPIRKVWVVASKDGAETKPIVGEDMICPVTHKHCDDECCPVGAECNLSDDGGISEPSTAVVEPGVEEPYEHFSIERLTRIAHALYDETRPIKNHPDPGAIQDCWAEIIEGLATFYSENDVDRMLFRVAELAVMTYRKNPGGITPFEINYTQIKANRGRVVNKPLDH